MGGYSPVTTPIRKEKPGKEFAGIRGVGDKEQIANPQILQSPPE
jgi:hypothetical protein